MSVRGRGGPGGAGFWVAGGGKRERRHRSLKLQDFFLGLRLNPPRLRRRAHWRVGARHANNKKNPYYHTPAVIARKRFAIVGDSADGGADATLPGVSSPLELVVESSIAASHAPLDACAAAGLTITLIGGGSVAVNGAPLAVGERVPLAPGARLLVDGCEWEVWRNEHAHA